ncbi:MAG: hypothetical protein UX80_C0024G0006 [Candidatus Amesbacteria bacterium GW2011_GWA2_47_11b]|uniref:Antitoxin n=3 Tax=Candidatus Amesiibacteriota TaxID=1752730 RepID=A0A0G1SJU7_9BACT|nr:MAG: hypothetical protein UX42_C0008G0017 [Microgenomates group bacterium GW2011_GWC1_46_20]KKU57140.1 MAG: hypothetical protein UX80_C0024G0006 [Candidatus Amesbacteria bacterium GW2011_GWA2_47_11b]KKU69697.1 MAG: hypothetical protein UX92_C0012G0040 [Candidatus Amesbacteria bacterium GW2011_GWA1_47_20]KKU83300.1 MAG: hypothetical protein UY11_C0023G0018 [Candidatus Amesbacteria bacterium GW2011_GWC2_47_8]
MDMQTITTTYAQRNFGKILDELDEPVIVMRDSEPEAVLMDYEDYKSYVREKKKADTEKVMRMLERIHKRNAHIPAEEVERDVEEALKYVRSHR